MGNITWKSNINQFLQALDKEVNDEVKNAAQKIYNQSQANCPVDTGTLKSSGYVDVDKNKAEVGYKEEYAAVVDFNTGFFREALVLNESDIVDGFTDAVNRAIKGVS